MGNKSTKNDTKWWKCHLCIDFSKEKENEEAAYEISLEYVCDREQREWECVCLSLNVSVNN